MTYSISNWRLCDYFRFFFDYFHFFLIMILCRSKSFVNVMPIAPALDLCRRMEGSIRCASWWSSGCSHRILASHPMTLANSARKVLIWICRTLCGFHLMRQNWMNHLLVWHHLNSLISNDFACFHMIPHDFAWFRMMSHDFTQFHTKLMIWAAFMWLCISGFNQPHTCSRLQAGAKREQAGASGKQAGASGSKREASGKQAGASGSKREQAGATMITH